KLSRDVLTKLYAKLVERIDPEQDGVRKRPVLIKCDQRAERACIEPLEQDCRAWPVAGLAALWIIARASLHERRALGEGVEQQQATMLLILLVIALANRDEFHRHEDGALVEKLKDRVLRIGPDSAPGDGRRRRLDRFAAG